MKRPATILATIMATNIGKKMLIEAVVSIIMTASEYVILQYEDNIAPTASKIGTTAALGVLSGLGNKFW